MISWFIAMYALMCVYNYALARGKLEYARIIHQYCNNNTYYSIIGGVYVVTCAYMVACIFDITALISSFVWTFFSKFLIIIILPTITCNIQEISKMKKYLLLFSVIFGHALLRSRNEPVIEIEQRTPMGDFLDFVDMKHSKQWIIFLQMLHPVRYRIIFFHFWNILSLFSRILTQRQDQSENELDAELDHDSLVRNEILMLISFLGLVIPVVNLYHLNYDKICHVKNYLIILSEEFERNRKLRV